MSEDLEKEEFESDQEAISKYDNFLEEKKKAWDPVDPMELWNLDLMLSMFIYPRIKAFIDAEPIGCPGSLLPEDYHDLGEEEKEIASLKAHALYDYKLKLIALSFKMRCSDSRHNYSPMRRKIMAKGMEAFAEFYDSLWT